MQNVDKIDIEAAISIIINKDMKGLLEPRPDLVEQIEVPTTTEKELEEELDKAFKELEDEEEDMDDNELTEEDEEGRARCLLKKDLKKNNKMMMMKR